MKKNPLIPIVFILLLSITIIPFKQSFASQSVDTIKTKPITIKCIHLRDGQAVIESKEDLQNLLNNNRSPHPACNSYQLPEIDFNKYLLVGIYKIVGGCKPPNYSTIVLNKQGVLKFYIDITRQGSCKRGDFVKFWHIIPKPSNYRNLKFIISIENES